MTRPDGPGGHGLPAGAATEDGPAAEEARLLGLAPRPASYSVRYGDHPSQVIDYYLPDSGGSGERGGERGGAPGSVPAGARVPAAGLRVTILHGGFWREAYDRTHLSPLAAELARLGMAVALAEYRRVGGGGGWPDTFEDVTRVVAEAWGPDAGAAGAGSGGAGAHVLLGHSAGGHLALWAAAGGHPRRVPGHGRTFEEARTAGGARTAGEACTPRETGTPGVDRTFGDGRTSRADRLQDGAPAPRGGLVAPNGAAGLTRVVAVSPVADLARAHALGLSGDAVAGLLGGPGAVAGLLADADPMLLPPPAVPVTVLHGTADPDVPVGLSRGYVAAVRRAGGDAELWEQPGAGHYASLVPAAPASRATPADTAAPAAPEAPDNAFAALLDALRGLPRRAGSSSSRTPGSQHQR